MDTHAATSTGPKQADQIPADLLAKIDEAVTHYPVSKRSASLPLLHLWQNHFGFIDDSGVNWIAARLDLEPINILELVTFYPWFRQEAPGKTIIRVCRTLSCALAGSTMSAKSSARRPVSTPVQVAIITALPSVQTASTVSSSSSALPVVVLLPSCWSTTISMRM
jgi:NADH:ubiquinone oxidoreductase subunit E